ncbi:Transposase DDE domain-containing protein [Salipiger thiooxidans]|uniref:Transposase DDE domain-containing protein n=1 Tax=Salipiger thiooxidans TaxID=282683 RepID=A0A1G7K9B0_9RHOB|nr:Transposase DDE domain-containing protein [Salipiger thiooxidans]
MVASLLRLAGPDWPVPDCSTLCRRQKTLKVQIPFCRAEGPLKLLVPSRDIAAQCPAGQWIRFGKAFGERIAARDPDRQTAEIHIRVALINRFNALGTAEPVRVA